MELVPCPAFESMRDAFSGSVEMGGIVSPYGVSDMGHSRQGINDGTSMACSASAGTKEMVAIREITDTALAQTEIIERER